MLRLLGLAVWQLAQAVMLLAAGGLVLAGLVASVWATGVAGLLLFVAVLLARLAVLTWDTWQKRISRRRSR